MARNSPSMGRCCDGADEDTVKDYDHGMRKPKKQRSVRANRKSILERFDKMAMTHIEEHRWIDPSLSLSINFHLDQCPVFNDNSAS